MNWLRRFERHSSTAGSAPDEPARGPSERVSPGLAALFHELSEDRSHAVLDLGPAANASLGVYRRFARRVRFVDLLASPTPPEVWGTALGALPARHDQPYDLVFAWNILDWTDPEERPRLVERLAELTSADARLLLVVDASGEAPRRPLRFAVLDVDRMRYEAMDSVRPAWPPLLPAEVARLLMPFQVVRAFTSKVGLWEYVAVRRQS